MKWYYVSEGRRSGPVSEQELFRLVDAGTVKPDTLIWKEGMKDWQPFSDAAPAFPAQSSAAGADTGAAPAARGNCCECGNDFPLSEMISYEGVWVCGNCKSRFFQKVTEGSVIPGKLNYGGFWIRFCAKVVDGLILFIFNTAVNMIYMFFIMGVYGMDYTEGQPNNADFAVIMGLQFIVYLIQIAFGAAYTTFFLGKFAATPGKMALGLKVVRPDGQPISYLRALGRHFAEWLSGIIFLIGYIMAAFDEERRTLHDRICDTRVISK